MNTCKRLAISCSLAAALAGISAHAALAQEFTARVTLPHEVRWGSFELPAGEYRLSMDSLRAPLQVRDANGQTLALLLGLRDDPDPDRPASLLVTVEGSKRTVRSLNCPEWGRSFVFKPLTREERSRIASQQPVEVIAMRVASR